MSDYYNTYYPSIPIFLMGGMPKPKGNKAKKNKTKKEQNTEESQVSQAAKIIGEVVKNAEQKVKQWYNSAEAPIETPKAPIETPKAPIETPKTVYKSLVFKTPRTTINTPVRAVRQIGHWLNYHPDGFWGTVLSGGIGLGGYQLYNYFNPKKPEMPSFTIKQSYSPEKEYVNAADSIFSNVGK